MLPESRKAILCLSLGLALLASACATTPYTSRKQIMMIPQSSEISLGYQAFNDVKRKYPLNRDPELNLMINRVGQRIAAAAHRPDFRWEFAVFQDDKMANAFCLPGGKVGVFTGILKYTKDEAGLATVISHEAAHAIARHAGERMSQGMLAQAGAIGLSLGLGGMNPYAADAIMRAYGLGANVGVLLPYSRTQEYEADKIGLILMAKAGYDPAAALDFWQRMLAYRKDKFQMPQFLSTHPNDENRIKAIKDYLPTAGQYYHPPGN
jgi:predicted Zn-dependent protease